MGADKKRGKKRGATFDRYVRGAALATVGCRKRVPTSILFTCVTIFAPRKGPAP